MLVMFQRMIYDPEASWPELVQFPMMTNGDYWGYDAECRRL